MNVYIKKISHKLSTETHKKNPKNFIKLFSIYFDRTKWVFSCIEEHRRLLFQGAEMCMTFFCCYVTVQIKAN